MDYHHLLQPFHLISFTTLLLTWLASSCGAQPAVPSTKHGNLTDLDALLTFRAHADPHGTLNWTVDGVAFCSWVGVRCSRRRQRVTAIRLPNFSLGGTVSPHLGNLSFLSELRLANNSLTGPIPESIGYLPRLAVVVLSRNSLAGLLPSSIFNMSSLTSLYVAANGLSGSLPSNDSFTLPPRLRAISLGDNRFTGDVALSSFVRYCRNIQVIDLDKNEFSGTIPAEIGMLSELSALALGMNRLTGIIPSSLGNLTMLTLLDLVENGFSGMIPEELGNLANLEYLAVARNGRIVGSIPTSLLNISKLHHFGLSGNKLTGSVPDGIGKSLPKLEWFHVGDNHLSGGLEFLSSLSNCENLEYLEIYRNALEGVLPNDVGNLSTNLRYFSAYGNLIKGDIPSALGNLTGLVELDLGINKLTGTIPSTLAGLSALQSLNLAFNRISGSLPFEFGALKNLNRVNLQYNALHGPIPDLFSNTPMMQYLSLDGNNFSSSIPQSLWTLRNLLQVDLSWNSLSGSLPPQVGDMEGLTVLDLSMNRLSGNISSALGKLQMLNYLNLSENSFQGQIPVSFGKLISLTNLDLSSNSLSGIIPESLANLPYLGSLNLSFNKLQGQVPTGRVFLNSSIPSLVGNEALCGAPQLNIPPCYDQSNSRRKSLSTKHILLITLLGAVLFTFLFLVCAFYWRRKVKSLPDVNVVPNLNFHHRAISHHELVRATENFSEENLVGRGGFGTVFRGCLDDGLVVAIKVLDLEVEGSSNSFDAECQVLKMARHKNLIKIISVCSNLDFKALVLEYMPSGSLENWLYADNYFLNLIQRLSIMEDVSLALEYLHHHHPQIVLHCDLKPTNILLDEELVAHVSDFGISKLLLGDSKLTTTTRMLGTIGYIAPEYATTGTVSRMGDVYSFGILLLETFTRKKPTDSMFDKQSGLREWICKAHPNAILDIVDRNILMNHDTSDHDLPKLHRCLSSVIELGLLCTRFSPKERIPMTDVVARLQKIKMEYLST